MSVIHAEAVCKNFGGFKALDGVSLNVEPGECFGLLGPNGAGKSTLIRILYGARIRDGGNLQVFGLDPTTQSSAIKRRLGVVPQENGLDDALSVHENLQTFGSYHGLAKQKVNTAIEELLGWMSLEGKASASVRALSGGMQRRLAFVRALIHSPEFLILDEPTTGLDPAVRQLLWQRVRELNQRGVTVLLTTHYMEEAQALCSKLLILDQGKVADVGTPKALIKKYSPGYVVVFDKQLVTAQRVREKFEGAGLKPSEEVYEDTQFTFCRALNIEDLFELGRSLAVEPQVIRPSNLEDVFLKVTGKELSAHA